MTSNELSQLLHRSPIHYRYYRAWLRAGILAALVGYAFAGVSILIEQPAKPWYTLRELVVILAACVALWCERRGKIGTAALIVLSALWLELHLSLSLLGLRAAVDVVFPALVLGVVLFCGIRHGLALAASTLLSVAGAIMLGDALGWGPGFSAGDLLYFVALEASVLTTVLLTTLFMRCLTSALAGLERNARQTQHVIDAVPDAIVVLSEHAVVKDLNAAATRLLGLPRERALGRNFDELPLTPLDAADQALHPREDAELRQYSARDGALMLEGLTRSMTHATGEVGTLVVLRDITARLQAEQRESELQLKLQHSQKLELVGQLAGGVAHDFNNLLTAIGGYGDLFGRHPDAQVQRAAQEISHARDRGVTLTRQLLAFARRELVPLRRIDLAAIVSENRGLAQHLLGNSIAFEVDAPEPCYLQGDPGQLSQVLLNLVINARDAMPEGGRLIVRCRPRPVAQRVELIVSDTGHGMNQATRERIFEPFFTTKPRDKGTGLGLASVHGIVAASGGRISVESEQGRGTRFTLSWPCAVPATDYGAQSDPPSRNRERGARVLLTQGDRDCRGQWIRLLEEGGHQVFAAQNGQEAGSRFRELLSLRLTPEILVSDVRLPDMTGLELARSLRRDVPELPVLFVSAGEDLPLFGSDFDPRGDVLVKPFTADAVIPRVEQQLARARALALTKLSLPARDVV